MNTDITTNTPSRLRRIVRTAVVGLALGAGTLATAGTADAAVVSPLGAAAETVGDCSNGSIVVDYGNYGFEYVRISSYVYNAGWNLGQWNQALQGGRTLVINSTGSAWAAFYVQYADWNGASWDIGGEWISFGSSYWCLV